MEQISPTIHHEQKTRPKPFDSLSPEEQDEKLSWVLFMIDTANKHEIKLNARHIALVLGYENEGRASRALDQMKKYTPLFLKSRKQRFDRVIRYIQEGAELENEEFDEDCRFSTWMDHQNSDRLAQARLTADTVSHTRMETPILSLGESSNAELNFSLEKLLNVSEKHLKKLPRTVQDVLVDRKEFWNGHGFASGPELKAFLEENFSRQEVSFDQKDPIEFSWLKTVHPEDYSFLKGLKDSGSTVRLVTCRKSPDSVLDAVRHIATDSQRKYVSTWLRGLVCDGVQPVVTKKDIENIERHYDRRIAGVQDIGGDDAVFRKKVITKMFADELPQKKDFKQSMDLISGFVPMYMYIEVSGPNCTTDEIQALRIREINKKFSHGVGNEYALRKIIFDDADNVSEKAQTIMYAMAVIGPAAHVLEHTLELPWLAKFAAASTDDVMSEWAEISALLSAGVKWSEIRSRFKVLAPALVVASVLAASVDPARETLGDRAAGAIYSTAAVFLSAVTCVLSAKLFADEYGALAREGKLQGFCPTIGAEEVEKIRKELEKTGETIKPENIWSLLEKVLQKFGDDEATIKEKQKQFFAYTQSKEGKDVFEGLNEPSTLKRYKAGVKEAMGVNPARFGIAMGSFTSVIFGFLAGPLFLREPILYAGAGSYESFAGAASILGHKMNFPGSWRRFVKKKISQTNQVHDA